MPDQDPRGGAPAWGRCPACTARLASRYGQENAETTGLILTLTDALDSLDRMAATAGERLAGSIRALGKQLSAALDLPDGRLVGQVGEKAEPGAYEVVETCAGRHEDRVAEVLRRGYVYRGRLLRPAQVIVESVANGSPS
jgi:molecular chaperone GrpE (heat shock protein)